MDNLSTMLPQVIECRPPPRVYSLYFKELNLSYKIGRELSRLNTSLMTLDEFFNAHNISPPEQKNLLCELYFHNYAIQYTP